MRVDRSARVHPSHVFQMLSTIMLNFDVVLHSQMEWPSLQDLEEINEREHQADSELQDFHVDLNIDSDTAKASFDNLQVNHDQITVLTDTVSGGFGQVSRGILVSNRVKIDVAVKTLRYHDSATAERFWLECRLLAAIKHPNIVKLLGVCSREQPFLMIREYMCNHTLGAFLRRFRPPDSDSEDSDSDSDSRSLTGKFRNRTKSPQNYSTTASSGSNSPRHQTAQHVSIAAAAEAAGSRRNSVSVHRDEVSVVELVDALRQISSAMAYLSSIHVIHRDLAARLVVCLFYPLTIDYSCFPGNFVSFSWVTVCFLHAHEV
jgi:serine/threonine protein kinase